MDIHHEQLHFRCAFDITPKTVTPRTWGDLVRNIRDWIARKESQTIDPRFNTAWFYTGGAWKPQRKHRPLIRTAAFRTRPEDADPEFWAIRYEHFDQEPGRKVRIWATDIGITSLGEGKFRLALSVSHYLRPEFVGEEPRAPMPSAPRLVVDLASSTRWKLTAGSTALSTAVMFITPGRAPALRRLITDSARLCPIVYLSLNSATGSTLLDSSQLARLLAGTARIVVASDCSLDEELEWILPPTLRCMGGMVRIYLPHANEADVSDHLRHRFYTRSRIEELGVDAVTSQIVTALSRRTAIWLDIPIRSIDDVERHQRFVRLADLRATDTIESQRELVQLLQEDNISLDKRLMQADKERAQASERLDETILALEEERDKLRALEYQRREAGKRAELAESSVAHIEVSRRFIREVDTLPADLDGIIDWIEGVFADRLVFTPEARAAARKAGINKSRADLNAVWNILRAMATDLYGIVFDEDGAGDIGKRFLERTGFELAMTERKQTNKDAKLMATRRVFHCGRELDITPHVKYGSRPPRLLRVHFAVDRDSRRIVIGHCGDHLDTAGTQRMN